MEIFFSYLPFIFALITALIAISLAVLIVLGIKALIKYLKSSN